MLTNCVECKREISDQAEACPHCGNPMKAPVAIEPEPVEKKRAKPIFLALAVVALLVGDGTPRFLIFFPVMCALGFSVVSMLRGERWSGWAWLTLILGFLMWGLSSSDFGKETRATSEEIAAEKSAKIVSSRWVIDPDFAGRGKIKWYVEVENISQRNIKMAEVEFTTYDAAGTIVSSTTTYVTAIPAGSKGSDDSFADLYRTEKTAQFRMKRVYFE